MPELPLAPNLYSSSISKSVYSAFVPIHPRLAFALNNSPSWSFQSCAPYASQRVLQSVTSAGESDSHFPAMTFDSVFGFGLGTPFGSTFTIDLPSLVTSTDAPSGTLISVS